MLQFDSKKEKPIEDLRAYLKKNRGEKRKQVKVTHNHIEHHQMLTNKKSLFYNMKAYCEERNDNVFNYVPLTFHAQGPDYDYKPL